jgi:heptosyltransferase II
MPEAVLVLAPNWLGDAVMALPSIADLKRTFPSTALTIAARPAVADMFELARYVDDVVPLEWRGRVLRQKGLNADVARLREIRADVAILLPNSFAAAWLTRRAEIPERWGYSSDMRSPLLTRAIRKPKGRLHQGRYYQHLVRELGAPSGPLEPVLAVPAGDTAAAMQLLTAKGWNGRRPIVAMAPGAAYGTAKRWLPRHFVRLIDNLTDVTCVLVGSAADSETIGLIRAALSETARGKVIDLSGATSLRMLAATLALADVCVSNDSGAMHLAAAVGVPLVALFGPTREDETAPLNRQDRVARVLLNPVWCRPCMLRECPIDHRCMKGLTPERVYASVRELIEGRAH